MSRRQLFLRLCAIATALEQEAQRVPLSAHTCVLLGCVEALDAVIDAVVDAPEAEAWGWLEDD